MRATVDWVAGPVTGVIDLVQRTPSEAVRVTVDIAGLKPGQLHGFHIHAKPAHSAADLATSCAACGGHFNPLNQPHGSVFVDATRRHVGDLINNVLADEAGRARVSFTDPLLTLVPTPARPYSVVGKSVVVHDGVDDLGQQGSVIRPPALTAEHGVLPGWRDDCRRYADAARRTESTVTGNAGQRRACGNIRVVDESQGLRGWRGSGRHVRPHD